ncbi:MAG TPA: VOC family protein [Geminicoccaceae bacterium]|nr:VOC family protein [Geminicoccus sp.]HMU53155.1 VOC family protein [Geminicoccaceae bacterium]
MTAGPAGAVPADGPDGAPPADVPFAGTTPISVGETALRVRDLGRMTAFYREAIGLETIGQDAAGVHMGAGGKVLLHLIPNPDAPLATPRQAGLFHIAFLMPSRGDLARWLAHAVLTRIPLTGFADHTVSEAIYLDDPEGNGLEIYSDRPHEGWRWRDGVVTMGTERLDIDSLLALADTARDRFDRAPSATMIGHMHLRVGDVAAGRAFYEKALGLTPTLVSRQDAAFLSSGGYHHHVAINSWNSRDAGPRDPASTGLDWFSLRLRDPDILAAQSDRLSRGGTAISALAGGIETADPWGTRVRLVTG